MKSFDEYIKEFNNRKLLQQLKRQRVVFQNTPPNATDRQVLDSSMYEDGGGYIIVGGRLINITPKISIQFGGSIFFEENIIDHINEFVRIFGLSHDQIDIDIFKDRGLSLSHFKHGDDKNDLVIVPSLRRDYIGVGLNSDNTINLENFLEALALQLEEEPFKFTLF